MMKEMARKHMRTMERVSPEKVMVIKLSLDSKKDDEPEDEDEDESDPEDTDDEDDTED